MIVVVKTEDGQAVRTLLTEAGAFDNDRKIRANADNSSLEIPVARKTKEELAEILHGAVGTSSSWEIRRSSSSFEAKKVVRPSQADRIAACVEKVKVLRAIFFLACSMNISRF